MDSKLQEIAYFLNNTLDSEEAVNRLKVLNNAELTLLVREFSCYSTKKTKTAMIEALVNGVVRAKLRSYAIRQIPLT